MRTWERVTVHQLLRGGGRILKARGRTREITGAASATTNKRMELTGALEALRRLKRPCSVDLYTESTYVCDGMTKWLGAWKRRGFEPKQGIPVKNADLWRALDAQGQRHSVRFHHVRGHSGHPENERCDRLARRAVRRGSRRTPSGPGGYDEPPPAVRVEEREITLPDGTKQTVPVKVADARCAHGASQQVHGRKSNKSRPSH